ncbi:MAG: recombinase family protein [Clostridia bacterium]|nr:recombinase family protein [Clostridia bacterium]
MEYSAALYMRLSKEDGKKDSGSIGSQKELLRRFAAEKGFSVFDEYIDDGFSGTNFERPAFKRMISDIEDGKINLVITKDLSRLGRDYISSGEFTEIYFPSKGVRYISVADCYDSENSFEDIIPFKNVFNEMYARDISRKIRFAFSARMKNGDFVGAFAPFGYKRSDENRHKLVVDENTAYIVKRIFSESAGGKRPAEIAKGLDSDNIPTPLDFRNKASKSRNWSSATILKILRNPVYLGHLEQGKTSKISFKSKKSLNVPKEKRFFIENTHEAIIDEKTFEKAGRKLRK